MKPEGDELPGGILAATLTPQDRLLRVDHDLLAAHCRWLLGNGCVAVAPLGTTGEGPSFSVGERKEVLDRLVGAGIPPSRILVGTGCAALPDTIELTRHAAGHRVGGVLLLPPFYFKGVRDEGLFAAVAAVVERVADPALRIYLYHFPRMTGIPFPAAVVERLLATFGGAIAGMKDSSGDLGHMLGTIRRFPGFRLYAGTESLLPEVLAAGGAGCISATTNVTCGLAARAMAATSPEAARSLIERLRAVRGAFERFPFVAGLKRWLAEGSGNPGWLRLRPPLWPLGEDEYADLRASLDVLGFGFRNVPPASAAAGYTPPADFD